MLEIDNKDIDNSLEINKELEMFFETLFKMKLKETKHVYNEFLEIFDYRHLARRKKSL